MFIYIYSLVFDALVMCVCVCACDEIWNLFKIYLLKPHVCVEEHDGKMQA